MQSNAIFLAGHRWELHALWIIWLVVFSFAFVLHTRACLRAKYCWLMRRRNGCSIDTFRAHFAEQDVSPLVTEKIYHYFQALTRFPGFAVLPDDRIRLIYGLDDKEVGAILDKLSGALQCGELDDADWVEGRQVKTIADLVIFFNSLRENRKRK